MDCPSKCAAGSAGGAVHDEREVVVEAGTLAARPGQLYSMCVCEQLGCPHWGHTPRASASAGLATAWLAPCHRKYHKCHTFAPRGRCRGVKAAEP